MQIMPPTMAQEAPPQAQGKGRGTWPDFLPNRLTPGASEEFRLLGNYGTGHCDVLYRLPQEKETQDGSLKFSGYAFFNEWVDPALNFGARETDWSNPSRPKIEGSFVKPKRAMVWIAWSYVRNRPELLIVEQQTLSQQLTEILKDEDYQFSDDGIPNFTIKIGRKGAGLETSYSLLPKMSEAKADVVVAFEQIKDTAKVAVLTEGRHPLIQKTEFKQAAALAELGDF